MVSKITQGVRRWLLGLVLAGAGMATSLAETTPAVESGDLVFSIVPRSPPSQTHRDWLPLLERLSRIVGARFSIRVYNDLSDFETDLHNGVPDFVFLNPYQQAIAGRRPGYVPLVREGQQLLSGLLVVRADSPIRTLADLRGKTIAYPHPNAFGASLYMRAVLHEKFGIQSVPRYVTTHTNVYRNVLRGLADAGGGVNATLNQEPAAVRDKLRVLYETPAVAPHPVSAHPRVPSGVRTAVARAIKQLAASPESRSLLATIGVPHPVDADHGRDYAPLARLHFEKYAVKNQVTLP